MKKIMFLPVMITGTLFSLFVFNIILFALVPSYHDALSEAVQGKSDIPTVIVEDADKNEIVLKNHAVEDANVDDVVTFNETADETALAPTFLNTEETKTSETAAEKENDNKTELEIVEKTYHEDCGTGKGYWVIKYSDGSYGIE